jgi:hypothetical protein
MTTGLVPLTEQLEHTAQNYQNRYLVGTVVSNNDPAGIGRFQVNIPELMQEGTLPWVGPKRSSPFGVGPGFGTYGSPAEGSLAIIELQNGDMNYPICVGYLLHASDKNSEFASPNVWGYVDPSGNKLVVDTSGGTYAFTHSSGTGYSIDQNGDLTANVKNNANVTIGGDATLSVTGNTTLNVTGTATVNVTGNASLTAPQTDVYGVVNIHGFLSVLAGMVVYGNSSSGANALFNCNVTQTNGYTITSNGVTLNTHEHTGGDGGNPTGAPIVGT